jgi:hypothetical protein
MSYHFKHIIFTSSEVEEIQQMTDSLVVPSSRAGTYPYSLHNDDLSVSDLEILSRALKTAGYDPMFVYEVFNPYDGYEVFASCHGNVDYIFSVKDDLFFPVLEEIQTILFDYSVQTHAVSQLIAASAFAVEEFLGNHDASVFSKNDAFSKCIEQMHECNDEAVAEVVFGLLRKYQLYPPY